MDLYSRAFSGGMDLGLERAGMSCKWQVEIDPYCNRVLEKHWPDVRRHDDVKTFPPEDETDWGVDLIAGGFPCQDISSAGKQAGIDGERSGLWSEYHRIIGVLRPRFVLVENVSALLSLGLGRVLGDLAAIGYDAEWHCLPASVFGAPHRRDRVFIIAHPASNTVAMPILPGRAGSLQFQFGKFRESGWESEPGTYWAAGEPGLSQVDDGAANWVGPVSGYGNAIVPQVAEWIGRKIMEANQ